MSDAPDLWKIYVIRGTQESSLGQTEHFESREEMEKALYDRMMQASAGGRKKYQSDGERRRGRMARLWRRAFEEEDWEKDEEKYGVKEVTGVWHLERDLLNTSNRWVEYVPTLNHPYVTVDKKDSE